MRILDQLKSNIKYYLRQPFEIYHNRIRVEYIKKYLDPQVGLHVSYETISNNERYRFVYENLTNKEFIIRSATALIDQSSNKIINVFSVASPGHHAECIYYASDFYGRRLPTIPNTYQTQGFITSYGRYVNRKEALSLAIETNQVKHKHGSPFRLFSEDMWGLTDEREDFRSLYLNHWTVKCSEFISSF